MEKLFYEMRPYFFVAVGLYALAIAHQSSLARLMAGSGLLLLAVSITIISMRRRNRGGYKQA